MSSSLTTAFAQNFLGSAPGWYKRTIVGFLILNPLLFFFGGPFGPTIAGWLLLIEFIFTLVMALKCYPLQPGGLLVIEAIAIGMTTPDSVYQETVRAFPVILLLVFMVAGIYFLRELLLYSFTKILLSIRSPVWLSLVACMTTALLSAFLDALTVVAVVITVGAGFYAVFHRFASEKEAAVDHDPAHDADVRKLHIGDLEAFRAFLRGLMMHASVGTALGGVATMVGEPQNLLIAKQAGWGFAEFFLFVAPVSMPVLAVGLLTCACVEKFHWFGYGTALPLSVRYVLEENDRAAAAKRTARDRAVLIVQGAAAILLVCALAFHIAEVGLIGLLVIILATAFNGVTDEHRLGKAFEAALPFTALLVVFFAVVAVLHDQHLFEPLIAYALKQEGKTQVALFYVANGLLSAISDNVFVATIYITEVKAALLQGVITPDQFNDLAVAINAGTNIPSVATPNGQAAFLFLLTSALAPLIRLSYGRMCWMALPYTVSMSVTGLLAVIFLL
ncbi:sodium/proton antiporter NhaB [Povalibacter sp.]|uniref:sodium/proton antiporter NhaB n=1 Tax=Povalibacter sp. TaxID=1962978 RepID=UPI002F3F066F